jgi:hypothetical protein
MYCVTSTTDITFINKISINNCCYRYNEATILEHIYNKYFAHRIEKYTVRITKKFILETTLYSKFSLNVRHFLLSISLLSIYVSQAFKHFSMTLRDFLFALQNLRKTVFRIILKTYTCGQVLFLKEPIRLIFSTTSHKFSFVLVFLDTILVPFMFLPCFLLRALFALFSVTVSLQGRTRC